MTIIIILLVIIVAILIPILVSSIYFLSVNICGGMTSYRSTQKMPFKLTTVDPHESSTWFSSSGGEIEYMDTTYHAFFHLRGGLGDIVRHLFASGVGKFLIDMPTNKRALVFLHSHTSSESLEEIAEIFSLRHSFFAIPWTTNLYETHPNLKCLQPYDILFTNRMQYMFKTVFTKNFNNRHELFSYGQEIEEAEHPYVVIQRCAGTRGRDIPLPLAKGIISYFNKKGIRVKHVGKHFKRGFVPNWSPAMFTEKKEDLWDIRICSSDDYEYLVDERSMSELRKDIAGSLGVITAFSSISLLTMEFKKPLLCLAIIQEDGRDFSTHFTANNKYHFWGGLEYTKDPTLNRYSFIDAEHIPKSYKSLPSQLDSPPDVNSAEFDDWCASAFAHFQP